jgi:hypothetical protein
MTKLKLFGAAVSVLSFAIAGQAMAQQVVNHSRRCALSDTSGNCEAYASSPSRSERSAYRSERRPYRSANRNSDNWNNGWRDSRNDNGWQRRDSGFWPGDVAADAVGAAVGTAGAIATAPFRGDSDSYAYYNNGDYNNGWNGFDWNRQTYAQRNGFVCTPGTWFKGDDGRRHPCQ